MAISQHRQTIRAVTIRLFGTRAYEGVVAAHNAAGWSTSSRRRGRGTMRTWLALQKDFRE